MGATNMGWWNHLLNLSRCQYGWLMCFVYIRQKRLRLWRRPGLQVHVLIISSSHQRPTKCLLVVSTKLVLDTAMGSKRSPEELCILRILEIAHTCAIFLHLRIKRNWIQNSCRWYHISCDHLSHLLWLCLRSVIILMESLGCRRSSRS